MISALWLAWMVVVAVATSGIYKWHLDYFKSPGESFHHLALILIPALPIGSFIYAVLRRKALVRREPVIFAAIAGVACLCYEPRATAVVGLLFFSCCASGRFLLRKAGIATHGPLEKIVAGFGAGVAVLNVVLFALGLARMLYPAVFLLLLIPPVIFLRDEVRNIFNDFRLLGRSWADAASARNPVAGVAVVFAFVAMICALMVALAPSTAFDSLAFHLPLVQYYAANHALRSVPGIDYSFYPQAMELVWTVAYALGGPPAAQLTSAMFFAVFLLLLLRLARECGLDQGTSVAGAAFAATLPFVHWSGSVMKNDLAMAFFEGLALLAFLRWSDGAGFRWIAAGTFFLTQAFGIKLVALFGALPLAILFGYAAWHEKRRWRAAGALAGMFLLFGTCWPVRDYFLTGNPVAPENMGVAVGQHMSKRSPLERIERDLEAPWQLVFNGEDFFESPLPNPAGILFFAFAPLAILGGNIRPRTRAQTACAIFAVVYLGYWCLILKKLRYAILPFSLLAMWMAARLSRFYSGKSRAVQVSLVAVAAYCLLIATIGLMIVGINAPQFAYFARRLDKPGYLRAAMRTYGAVEFLRKNAAPHAKVFGVENLSRAYSADPESFDGMLCPGALPCDAAKVTDAARAAHAEYLILPENGKVAIPEVLAQSGLATRATTRVYVDSYYSIYHFEE